MTPKKILHLYSSWSAGGAEKVMLDLASGLEKKNLKNIIACPGGSFLYNTALNRGLSVYPVRIKGSFDPIGLWKLWRIVQKEDVDIIHAHQGKVFWPCVIMKLLRKRPLKIVFHRHAQLPHRFYSRGHYLQADAIIAISQAVADGLVKREKVPESKVKVVYNGTDFSRFHPGVSGGDVRKQYNLEGCFVIGTVAAMNRPKGKGQQTLIEAAKILHPLYPDVRFLIVGNGPLREELERSAGSAGLDGIVIFTGQQEPVDPFMAAMDVLCLLSWDTEGFGQVLVEAQGLGKPVIGTTVGGVPETFDNGKTGFLIAPENPKLLAQTLEQFITNRSRTAHMGNEAVSFARTHFSMERMLDNIAAIYREIL